MKANRLIAAAATAFALAIPALPAFAAPDADAANKFAKDNGCTKCHSVDKTKKGPSFQKTAAKYKGKADAEATLTKFLTSSPKVKMDDGSEEDHKAAKAGPELKNMIQFILAQ